MLGREKFMRRIFVIYITCSNTVVVEANLHWKR